jgi:SagB-type dehydrogenase family enzyme
MDHVSDATSVPALPERPRFVDDVAVVRDEAGVVFDGTDTLWGLRGDAARTLVPVLIPLLDGTRDVQELERAVPHGALRVRDVLCALAKGGLLEDGPRPTQDEHTHPALSFLRRFATEPGRNRGRDAYDTLRASEVLILGAAGPSEALLSRVLLASGVGRVLPLDLDRMAGSAAARGGASRLAISLGRGDAAQRRREVALDEWCRNQDLPWLRLVYRAAAGRAEIGPLFRRGPSPCYRCFDAVHADVAEPVEVDEGVSSEAAVWIGLAAFEATCMLGHLASALSAGSFRRYDVHTGDREELSWCRVPGCLRCLPRASIASTANAATPRMHTPIVFEDAVAFHASADTTSRVRRRVMADVEHSRYVKRLSVSPSLALPRAVPEMSLDIARALRGEVAAETRAFGVEQLSAVLRVTAGLRACPLTDGPVPRWAPSAGNLGSPELFVAVRNVDGLRAGLYYYDAHDHVLTSLNRRRGEVRPDDLMARVLRCETDLPDALVIFTGAFHRIARKYGAFAYRLMHLDAGVAAVQMRLATAALGLHSRVAAIWPDDLLDEQLQLQRIHEQVTAVVSLAARPLSPMRLGTSCADGSVPSRRALTAFADWNALDVLESLIEEASVSETTLQRMGIDCGTGNGGHRDAVGGASVGALLARRQSTRTFSSAAIPTTIAAELIADADDSDAQNRLRDEPRLTYQALQCSTGEASVCRFDGGSRALVREATTLPQSAVDSLYVQDECASAPVHIWILGDLQAACDAAGARGYRRLLFRAGWTAHHLALASLNADIEGTIVGGIKPQPARTVLGHDGYDETPLVAFVGGRRRHA